MIGESGVAARLARPLPGRPLGPTEVSVSPALAEMLGAAGLSAVLLRGPNEVAVPAAVLAVQGSADEGPVVRPGSMLWADLAGRPGEPVQVAGMPDSPMAEIQLVPAFHLFHRLGDKVTTALRARQMPVSVGSTIFVESFSGGGGVVLRVAAADVPLGRVTEDTAVTFGQPDGTVGRRRQTMADVGGLQREVARVRELVELPLVAPGVYRGLGIRPTKGVLLSGPPGVGKTLLCRAVGAQLNADVFAHSAADLVGAFAGETEANLRKAFTDASHHAPALIVIDELDALAVRRDAMASQGDVRVATALLSLMDGLEQVDGVIVMATTNRPDAIDEAFRRPGRFDVELTVGLPDEAARKEILAVHSREMPLSDEAWDALLDAAAMSTGFTGADLMHLVRETGLAAARRVQAEGAVADLSAGRTVDVVVEPEDVARALDQVTPALLRAVPLAPGGPLWDDLEGLDRERAELEKWAADVLSTARHDGLMLCGPSGSGKSALVHALAARLQLPAIRVDGAQVFNQWLGESEAAVRHLFKRSRQVAPAVVVLDHLDALAGHRDRGQDRPTQRVLAALLAEIDATREQALLVVGLTDRPDLVDPAVMSTGRLGHRLTMGTPEPVG